MMHVLMTSIKDLAYIYSMIDIIDYSYDFLLVGTSRCSICTYDLTLLFYGMQCVHLFLDNGEDADDGLCSGYRQQFEGSCGMLFIFFFFGQVWFLALRCMDYVKSDGI